MTHDEYIDGRNISTAEREWDSAIQFSPQSNTHSLVEALLSAATNIDTTLGKVYHSHHIDTATGEQLEAFGDLVGVERETNEGDERYRTRVKSQIAAAITDTDFDSFVQFSAAVFDTDVSNLQIVTNYGGDPATVTLSVPSEVLEDIPLSNTKSVEILGDGVPAGHEVKVQERGTFRLKADGEPNDPSKGLTSDSIETGGTLAEDVA